MTKRLNDADYKEERKRIAIAKCRLKRIEKGREGIRNNVARPGPEARQQIIGTAPTACKKNTRGAGVSCDDIYHPYEHQPSDVVMVEDERLGEIRCRGCGALVQVVEVNGVWTTRDDDGLPHKLTCASSGKAMGSADRPLVYRWVAKHRQRVQELQRAVSADEEP